MFIIHIIPLIYVVINKDVFECFQNYTKNITVPSHPYINGSCGDGINVLDVYFNETWMLSFTFTITQNTSYKMDKIKLKYVLGKTWFPQISAPHGRRLM